MCGFPQVQHLRVAFRRLRCRCGTLLVYFSSIWLHSKEMVLVALEEIPVSVGSHEDLAAN